MPEVSLSPSERKQKEKEERDRNDLFAMIQFALEQVTVTKMGGRCMLCKGFWPRQNDKAGMPVAGECHRYAPRSSDVASDATFPKILSSLGCMEFVEDEGKIKWLKEKRAELNARMNQLKADTAEPANKQADPATADESSPQAAEKEKGGKGKW